MSSGGGFGSVIGMSGSFGSAAMTGAGALTGLTGSFAPLGVGFAALSGGAPGSALVAFTTAVGGATRAVMDMQRNIESNSRSIAKNSNQFTEATRKFAETIVQAADDSEAGFQKWLQQFNDQSTQDFATGTRFFAPSFIAALKEVTGRQLKTAAEEPAAPFPGLSQVITSIAQGIQFAIVSTENLGMGARLSGERERVDAEEEQRIKAESLARLKARDDRELLRERIDDEEIAELNRRAAADAMLRQRFRERRELEIKNQERMAEFTREQLRRTGENIRASADPEFAFRRQAGSLANLVRTGNLSLDNAVMALADPEERRQRLSPIQGVRAGDMALRQAFTQEKEDRRTAAEARKTIVEELKKQREAEELNMKALLAAVAGIPPAVGL